MIDSPHFDLKELICPHVYQKYGSFAWNFLDYRAIVTINTLRDKIGKAVFVNNYDIIENKVVFLNDSQFDERGLRCCFCDIVKKKLELGIMYMSAHCLGKGFDFDVEGLVASEVRDWIILHANWWPYSIRLEDKVNWVHFDLFNSDENNKVVLFNVIT
jgi:hypothetical protein